MAFRFSDSFGMFDITPVENLFIEEYMLRAPGDYVKVYLYGLRFCYHADVRMGEANFARALGMEEDAVRGAFSYWEKQGLLRRVSDQPPTYEYNNLKAVLVNAAAPEDAGLYRYRDFNNALQALFGARLLAPRDYARAAEWVEELALSEDAVLLMVRRALADRGGKVSFAYLDKIAVTWAKNGLLTKAEAEDHLRRQGSSYQGASHVLKAMGLRRAPTVAEEKLHQKWIDDWGFTPEALEEALKEMTKIANPNFAYLDKVLKSAHGRGTLDKEALRAAQGQREARYAPVREMLAQLGAQGSVTDDLATLYEGWLGEGFNAEALGIIAQQTRRQGGRTLQDIEDLLPRYRKRKLYIGGDIRAYGEVLAREKAQAHALKSLAGDDGPVTPSDLTRYRNITALHLSSELVELAATYAAGARDPLAFIHAIAKGWAEKHITTIAAAQEENKARQGGGGIAKASGGKKVSAQQYAQRDYGQLDLDALAMNLDAMDEEES